MRRYVIIGIIGIVAIMFLLTYLLFDPAQSDFFPKCPFLYYTGLKCPGCGTQRAIHALLSGNFAQAWHFNAAFVICIPLIALYGIAEFTRRKMPQFYKTINDPRIIWSILIFFIAWWILRNIFNW